MKHQINKRKLNLKYPHRQSMLRNQVMHLITYGHLTTTTPSAQAAKIMAEKLVTIAREGKNFNAIRRVKAVLPYKDEVIEKLFTEIAPKYLNRQGGYTRTIKLPRRISDTAPMSRIEWV